MRALTVLSSLGIPGSGQFAAGQPWRGLAWVLAARTARAGIA